MAYYRDNPEAQKLLCAWVQHASSAAQSSMNDRTRIALYSRIGTSSDSNDTQRLDLGQIASARGWTVVNVYKDNTTSKTGRLQPSALDALLKAAARREFDLLAIHSLDHLGQSLRQILDTVHKLRDAGIHLFVHESNIDTTSPAGAAIFSVFAALRISDQTQIRQRAKAAVERARRNGTKIGRPTNMNDSVRAAIIALRARDLSIRQIATQLRVGTGTIYKALGSET